MTVLRVAVRFAKSDTGLQRRGNEDSFFERAPVFAVADGMGGARAGEVASRMVVEALAAGLPDGGSPEERLAERAREANRAIHELAQSDPSRTGMGTTLTAAYVGEDLVSIAHVGDSRAYRVREGQLELLTRDHSLVGELVRRGKLTEAEAEDHPQRSVITRALGPEPDVEVDTWSYPAQAGDLFLLCSDGLTSMVDERAIAHVLRDAGDLARAGQALIDEANRRGGRDNITVILFRLEEVDGLAGASTGTAVDQPTEVGMSAVTPEQVAAASGGAAAPATDASVPPVPVTPPAMRTAPPRSAPAPAAGAREPRREGARRRGGGARSGAGWLAPVIVVVLLVAVIAAGAWIASRAVYFVGTDGQGFVAVFQGLPYEGPAGLRLYDEAYVSGVPATELPPARRRGLLDHQLRSQNDARDLVRKLELGEVGG